MWAAVLVPAVLVGAAGAYAWADAADLVPGLLTSAPLAHPRSPRSSPPSPLAVATPSARAGWAACRRGAGAVARRRVQALAAALRADKRTGKSTNVVCARLPDGRVLADLTASNTQVPASTTKLLTAVAALEHLGPDFTVQTRR